MTKAGPTTGDEIANGAKELRGRKGMSRLESIGNRMTGVVIERTITHPSSTDFCLCYSRHARRVE